MSIQKFDKDMAIVSALDDEPNDVGGMTSGELKEKFDEGGKALKTFLNDVLIPVLENLGVETSVQLPDGAGFKYIRLSADKVLETSEDGATWQATGSSGHLILDKDGKELPQRSRMRFMNGTVTDENGVTVITGVKGDKGDQGEKGDTGDTGAQGPIGKTGPVIVPRVDVNGVMSFSIQDTATAPGSVSVRGPQGPQGVQGLQGAQGERGPQGIQGVQGVQGPKGEKGDTGETGPVGPQGVQGIQGIQGKQGETGPAGSAGPVGATGPQGPKGDTGAQGPQGIQGETGPQGPVGAQGPAGPQGERGPAGADGRSFVIQDIYPTLAALKEAFPTGNDYAYQVTAEDKEIFIWSEIASDWVSAGALQGPQGPQGIQGIQGPKGDTGEQGPQGIQGPAGPQGPTGETGPQGPKGDTGATGPEGPQGIQGPQGVQGIQGEKGDKGDKGDTGAQGPQGEQGVQGPEGPQGPAGVAGADGKSAYQTAVDAGYAGTETAFNQALKDVPGHIANTENPHGVTAAQAGAIPSEEKGTANGVATLGADALLAAAQRPKAGGLYRDDGKTTLEKSLTEISTTLQNKADLDESGKVPESQLPSLGFKPQIVVTAPTGSAVTATQGSKVYTASESGGTWTFKVEDYGTYTITATKGDQTATGEVIVEAVQQYAVELKYIGIYGVTWDGTSSQALTRTDDAAGFTDPVPYVAGASSYGSPFDNLMPWAGMTKETRTGGVMVKIPKFWYKLTKSGNTLSIQIADAAVDGFSVCPACMDRGDGKGERDAVYVGRYHCGANDYKSVTGVKPKANVTRANFRSSIHSLGSNIWQLDFATRFTIWLLYIVEFANWNSQKTIGKGCGDNSATGNMGYTDSMPYHTGTTQSSRDTYGLGTQYRNIEGLWDNVYDWCDGCYNSGNGLMIILNPSSFSDSSGGQSAGTPADGWIAAWNVTTSGGFPMFINGGTSGGGENAAVGDYWSFGASSPCVCVGGYYGQGDYRGLFCVGCDGVSGASGGRGSRVLELP